MSDATINFSQRLIRWINPTIFPLLLVNFIGALGYSVILPFLVFLVQDFGGNAILYAVVGATYPAFQMLGAPLLGSWSDRVGRKKVLLISQIGTFISWGIFLLAFALPIRELFQIPAGNFGYVLLTLPLLILMLARAVDGLTGGNISVANAYLADITEPEDRKANYGKLAAAMNLGFIIGPTLSGLLTALPNGKVLTVLAAAGISLIGILVIWRLLSDVPMCDEEEHSGPDQIRKVLNHEIKDCRRPPTVKSSAVWSLPYFRFFLILYFLIFLVFNFFFATFPVHASTNLNWDAAALGIFFTLLSSSMIVTQTFLLPRLSVKYSDAFLFSAGSFILVFAFALMTLPAIPILYISAGLYGLGNGLMWPSFLSMLSKIGTQQQQGRIQGLAGSVGSLASIIGLIAGGFLFNLIDTQIFLISTVGIGLIGILAFRLKNI